MSSSLSSKSSALLITALALASAEANANSSGSFYIVPATYYAAPDSKLAADHDFGVQISVGTYLSKLWQAELISESTKFKRDDGTDTYKQFGASIQAIFSPFDDLKVRPLFIGGAGWLHTSTNTQSEDRPLARAGVGLQWQIPETSWGIRGTAIWRHEFNSKLMASSSDLNTTIYSVGVSYRFGGNLTTRTIPSDTTEPTVSSNIRTESPARIEETVGNKSATSSSDQDGDGISDTQDKCPDTPHNAIVDADGCPIRLK